MWATQPYAYGGNNPLRYVDPSGQLRIGERWDGGTGQQPVQGPTTAIETTQGSGVQTLAFVTAAQPAVTCDGGLIIGARECYRWGKIHGPGGLEDQEGLWRLGGHAAIFLSTAVKFVLDVKGARPWNAVIDGLDFFSQFSDFLNDLGDRIGGWFQHVAREAEVWIQRIMGVLDVVRGILSMPFVGEVIQFQLNLVITWLMPWMAGPFGFAFDFIETTLGGAVADLLAGGGHLAIARADQLREDARLDDLMSLDAFCEQDGGCPAQ